MPINQQTWKTETLWQDKGHDEPYYYYDKTMPRNLQPEILKQGEDYWYNERKPTKKNLQKYRDKMKTSKLTTKMRQPSRKLTQQNTQNRMTKIATDSLAPHLI